MGIQTQLSERLWKYLNSKKEPGETFDEVIIRLLDIKKELEKHAYQTN
jgi:predicted CopG family antitoxin